MDEEVEWSDSEENYIHVKWSNTKSKFLYSKSYKATLWVEDSDLSLSKFSKIVSFSNSYMYAIACNLPSSFCSPEALDVHGLVRLSPISIEILDILLANSQLVVISQNYD